VGLDQGYGKTGAAHDGTANQAVCNQKGCDGGGLTFSSESGGCRGLPFRARMEDVHEEQWELWSEGVEPGGGIVAASRPAHSPLYGPFGCRGSSRMGRLLIEEGVNTSGNHVDL